MKQEAQNAGWIPLATCEGEVFIGKGAFISSISLRSALWRLGRFMMMIPIFTAIGLLFFVLMPLYASSVITVETFSAYMGFSLLGGFVTSILGVVLYAIFGVIDLDHP